ncbi:hypothetical protein [Sulfolobus acidocaldarius]|uniref:hypothetical protein n=1 Tax=Sulfolobus acidocaldarius TaxID=2285 RepID=UPI000B2F8096|nr:hypothetical protein [Sulfolobus acidocaldarius]
MQNDRNVLLCTFRYNESNEFGSFYNKFPGSLDSIEHYTKEYVKAGTGVIAPCDGY